MMTFALLLTRLNELDIVISIDPKMGLGPPLAVGSLEPAYREVLRQYRNELIRVALARDLLVQADSVEYPHVRPGVREPADAPGCLAAGVRERMLRWEALLVSPAGVQWSVISRRPVVRRPGSRGVPPGRREEQAVYTDHDIDPDRITDAERLALPKMPPSEIYDPEDILDGEEDPIRAVRHPKSHAARPARHDAHDLRDRA